MFSRGLRSPASGKSTYARELAKAGTPYVIVNRDSIRESRGEYWIPEQEDYISDMEEYAVRSAIKRNLIPIIDATNLNPKTMEKWESLAKEFDCEIEYKKFYVSSFLKYIFNCSVFIAVVFEGFIC